MTPILVYQGGHHNVWCDGKQHTTTSGGYANIAPKEPVDIKTSCDCAYWQAFNKALELPP